MPIDGCDATSQSRPFLRSGLIAGVNVLSSGGRREHVEALITSSTELSTLSRNIHHLMSLLRQSSVSAAQEYRAMLDTLAADVHAHLRLVAEVLIQRASRHRGRPWRDVQGTGRSARAGRRLAARRLGGSAARRLGGTPIAEIGYRREAFNIMLSMPRGVDPLTVQRAAREFARSELPGHKYIMVLHDHQANPHVHISARAESRTGKRLNPRKADLQRWRGRFAGALRGWGVEAEASSRVLRGQGRQFEVLWRSKAREGGRLKNPDGRAATRREPSSTVAVSTWEALSAALARSGSARDRALALAVQEFFKDPHANRHAGRDPRGALALVLPSQGSLPGASAGYGWKSWRTPSRVHRTVGLSARLTAVI
jgi:hypothetical protein